MRVLTQRADALPGLAEVFREHGFEGASLSLISKATKLGKGSLYNFFPGGKEEMMAAVLGAIDHWFTAAIFSPLEQADDPRRAIALMFDEVATYFRSGGRVCLVGSLGLSAARDTFGEQVRTYFVRWVSALATCLEGAQIPNALARTLAEEAVAAIQGAIVLSRALDDAGAFRRIVRDQKARLLDAVSPGCR